MSANEPRNPNEGRRPPPNLLTLETIGARLTMVERCIVRDAHDAADQLRELSRLLAGVVEYLQHQATLERDREREALQRFAAEQRRLFPQAAPVVVAGQDEPK